MAVVLKSCSVNVSFHSPKCLDLYDKVYDYFTHITKTEVFQCFMEKEETTRKTNNPIYILEILVAFCKVE